MEYINKILWSIAICFIFINAIYYSVKLNFPQFKIKDMFNSLFSKKKIGKISGVDTLFMSLAAKIGIGSLSGIAFAIYYGGIGTIFWMWVSSFFIAINSYVEKYLSTKFKEKDGNYYKGGPAYYIKKGLNKKKLSNIYAIVLIFAYIFGFLSIQSNTVTIFVTDTFDINKLVVILFICIFSGIFIFKGLKAISSLCNKIVPIMAILYIFIGVIVFIFNINLIPNLFNEIINSVFAFKSISGGVFSTFLIGLQKSIFSSEAGIGTGAIATGCSDENNFKKQGYLGIIETYFINLLVASITTFIIYSSNYKNVVFNNINGIELTKYAFHYHFGTFGNLILMLLIVLFAFSTIITGYYYGESNLKIFTSKKWMINVFKIITILLLFLGGIVSSNIIWQTVDIFVAILAIINIYSIFSLRKDVNN